MKILYVINNAAFFCSHRLPIALAARGAGHEVAIATGVAGSPTMENLAIRQLQRENIRHFVLGFTSGGLNPFRELFGLVRLIALMRRWRPEIVHCASPKGLLYGGLAARIAGVPGLVLAVSGMGSMATKKAAWPRRLLGVLYSRIVRLAYAHPNKRVIVQNQDDRSNVVNQRFSAAEDVELIPGSGVQLPTYLDLDIDGRQPLVVLPARLLRDKGVVVFVDAVRMLRQRGVVWRFALVGAADYANPSSINESEIREWQTEGLIEWWGHRSDMAEVLGQTRIVCLPSFYGEGMPKSLLEAAAAGCAVITSDAPGCREAVQPGVTGDIVPACDASALADALHALINDPPRCVAYGNAGRAMARERFDIGAVIDRTLMIYHELDQNRA